MKLLLVQLVELSRILSLLTLWLLGKLRLSLVSCENRLLLMMIGRQILLILAHRQLFPVSLGSLLLYMMIGQKKNLSLLRPW